MQCDRRSSSEVSERAFPEDVNDDRLLYSLRRTCSSNLPSPWLVSQNKMVLFRRSTTIAFNNQRPNMFICFGLF